MSFHIVGVDPGFARIGLASLHCGKPMNVDAMVIITTKPTSKKRRLLQVDDNLRRLADIIYELRQFLRHWMPVAICCEAMSFPRNASSAAKVAMFWGALMAVASEMGIPVYQATPQEIKRAVCGKKDASKEEVERALKKRFKPQRIRVGHIAKGQRNHVWDALGAAVAVLGSNDVLARLLAA